MSSIPWQAGIASRLFAGLLSLSLVLFIYKRSITPIYGSAPATHTLNAIAVAGSLLAIHPLHLSQRRILLAGAVLFAVAPQGYWVAVWTARWDKPILGPLLTHVVVLLPLLYVLTLLVVEPKVAPKPKVPESRNSVGYRSLAALTACVGGVLLSQWWGTVSYLNYVSETQVFLALAAAMVNICIMESPVRRSPAPKKKKGSSSPSSSVLLKTLLVIGFDLLWWKLSPRLASPVLQHPLPAPYLHPNFPVLIHSSVQSVTGLIVVGEALPPPTYEGGYDTEMHSLRYLRADHSLLGGVWVGGKIATLDGATPQVDSFGTPLGDSIYSTFVLQEAARLVNSTAKGAAGQWDSSLIIGLGAGISASGFSRLGISTTIVEIDPAVYEAARLYFGLPDPDAVFLEDARAWVARKQASIEAGEETALFDIIVHDCFSGGGVPEHIFTVEFWNSLKATLHPEGVLVVNSAGSIISSSSRMISQTLLKVFGNCRAFHDLQDTIQPEQYDSEILNLVFFCTPHPNPLTFRKSRRSDYLDSYLREHKLSTLPNREVAFEVLTGELEDRFVLTDSHNPLGKMQDELGHHHWSLMRQVLPNVFWETY